MEELRARVVGPLQVVDDHEELPRGRERLEQLNDRAEEARLARLGKIGRQHGHRHALRHGRHERRDLRERHGRQLVQRRGRRELERLRHEVDHGLIRHRRLDLVAIRRERRRSARARLARELAREPALADSGLAFDERHVTGAGAEMPRAARRARRSRCRARRTGPLRLARRGSARAAPCRRPGGRRSAARAPSRGTRRARAAGSRACRRVARRGGATGGARPPRSCGWRNASTRRSARAAPG